MKKILALTLAVVMACSLAACGGSSSSDSAAPAETEAAAAEVEDSAAEDEASSGVNEDLEPIYFAWYGPMTGDDKQYGDTEMIACEMALDVINNEWGGLLGGRKVIIDYYDDKNDATEAVTIANKVVGDGKYSAAIGGFGSTPTMAAAPIYQEAHMVNYSPTSSHADYSSLGDYMFRNTPTQTIETAAYADYVYNDLGIRTVCILYVNDDWGNNISQIFTDTFEDLGGEVLYTESYLPNATTDFSSMIAKAKTYEPEAFFPVAYYEESANILKQADALDFDAQMILSSSTLKQELLDLAGDLANGCFLMNSYVPDIGTPAFDAVVQEYEEITGGKQADAFVMQTYDVVMQLATAIEECGSSDPEDIRDALDGMTYEAIAGEYTMNELGDAVRKLWPIRIIDGEFVNIAYGDPSKEE